MCIRDRCTRHSSDTASWWRHRDNTAFQLAGQGIRMASIRTTTKGATSSGDVARRRFTWYKIKEGVIPYLLIAPLLILVAVFVYWPLIYSTYLSFFDWNFVRPDKNLSLIHI